MPKPTFFNLPEDKRGAILDVAIDEFADNDYKNASISRLVARAGIAKGSFYQYFEDKQDLFMHLLDVAVQEKLAFLRDKQPPDLQMGLFPYLRWLFVAGTGFEFSRPKLSQVAYRALYGDVPFGDESLKRMKEAGSEYFKQLIEMGMAQGDVDPEIDPDLAAFVLGTLLNEFGNYVMPRLGLDPGSLAKGGAAEFDSPAMQAIVDDLLYVLEQGLGRKAL